MWAEGCAGMGFQELGVEIKVLCCHGQDTALGHGIPRIDGEVHQRLLQLGWIDQDEVCFGIQIEFQPDVLPDQPTEEFLHAGKRVVQIENLGIEELFPAEGKQLAGYLGGAASGIQDHVGILDDLGVVGPFVDEEGGKPVDGGEQVVEVVRDAAGEKPEGLHFLGLAELILQIAQVCEVAHGADKDTFPVVSHLGDLEAHGKEGGVAAPPDHLAGTVEDGPDSGGPVSFQVFIVFVAMRVGHDYGNVLARQIGTGKPEKAFGRRIHGLDDSVLGNGDDGIESALRQGMESGIGSSLKVLKLGEFFLHLAETGQVCEDAERTGCDAVWVAQQKGLIMNIGVKAVVPAKPVIAGKDRLPGLGSFLKGLQDPFTILFVNPLHPPLTGRDWFGGWLIEGGTERLVPFHRIIGCRPVPEQVVGCTGKHLPRGGLGRLNRVHREGQRKVFLGKVEGNVGRVGGDGGVGGRAEEPGVGVAAEGAVLS